MKEHTKQLAEALNVILDEIIVHERKSQTDLTDIIPSKSIFTMQELDKHFEDGHDFLANPIGQSLRLGLQHIGQVIATKYGLKALEEVVDFIAAQPSGNWKVEVLDKWFDGVSDANGDEWVS